MFNIVKKRYITFNKQYKHAPDLSWREIRDDSLLHSIKEVLNKYNVELISFNFNNAFRESKIYIKCNKTELIKIKEGLLYRLGAEIEHVQ